MDYKKHYDALMARTTTRILEGYVEKHHILPKCMGGSDASENIAVLTPEEHFLAHQLLVKMYPGNRDLLYATQMMTFHSSTGRITNKLFGWLRKQMSVRMSQSTKEWIATNGHPRGFLGKAHSISSKIKTSHSCKMSAVDRVGVVVHTYNFDGSYCKSYDTITDCAVDLNTRPSNVKYTAEGRFSHCMGKIISYVRYDCVPPYVKPISPLKGREKTADHVAKLKTSHQLNRAKCNKCGFESSRSAITRFHDSNCKIY